MGKYKGEKKHREAHASAPLIMPSYYAGKDYRLIKVFVEGYGDVGFWRGIFDDYETSKLKFEISVPLREDLAKGKQALLRMQPLSSPDLLLCMDSDFDYIFGDSYDQSRLINNSPYLFHTYAYATENFTCYPPSLHNVCAKVTKNDTAIFDFVRFMEEYSRIVYPLFLWYAYSAGRKIERAFSLIDFRSSVRLNYLDLAENGAHTLDWLQRQVDKRRRSLENQNEGWAEEVERFGKKIALQGVEPSNVHLFMQGHTLMDNVVIVVLHAVCDKLKEMTSLRISAGTKQGVALRNELSNYTNSVRNVREVLLDNEQYKDCFLYKRLQADIENYIRSLNV